VTNLYLGHCQIETIESGAFDGMDALLELKLESNRLNYLHGSSLFPGSLHHVEERRMKSDVVKRKERNLGALKSRH
jgi:hypothetical protein